MPFPLAPNSSVLRHRGLLTTLTARELKARYRGSVLGFLWSLVNPLLLLGVYSFVFGIVLGARAEGADPYPVYLVCGLFPWIWASTSLLEGTLCLTANAPLIRKAVFPAELLPIVSVLSNLVHFLLAIPIVGAALLVARSLGYEVGGVWALLLPLVTLLLFVFLAGAALGLGALNVHFKDVRDLVTNLLTLLFFLTPILYPLAAIPERFRWPIRINPFTPFTLAYQDVLFYGRPPALELWWQMVLIAVVGWSLGSYFFDRLSGTLAEAV